MLRLDTWKYALIDDEVRMWSNSYYLDEDYLPTWRDSYDGHDAGRNFVLNERDIHTFAVHYSHVTLYSVDSGILQGMTLWPYEGGLLGFWDFPTGLAPWSVVMRAELWPDMGHSRQLWIRGCLQQSDIVKDPKGRLAMTKMNTWNGTFQTVVSGWQAYPQTWPILIRNEVTPAGAGAVVVPTKWFVTGASECHAIDRRAARATGNGPGLFQSAFTLGAEIVEQWRSAYVFVTPSPHQWFVRAYVTNVMTLLGQLISLVNEVNTFFQVSDGSDSNQGHIPRYYPDAETITAACDTLKGHLDSQKDNLTNLTWNGDPPLEYLDDAGWSTVQAAVQVMNQESAFLPSLDYRTPVHDSG